MLKRPIALLLSLIMILSALPMAALAETEPTAATQTTQPAKTQETAAATEPAAQETAKEQQEAEEPKKLQVTAKEIPAWGKTTAPQQLRTKSAKIQLLRDAIVWDFQNAQVQENAESLLGYCGVLASYQMFYRGINDWRKSSDGKNHFDEYSAMSMTSGGYVPQAYAAVDKVQEQSQEQAEGQTQESETPKGKTLEQILNQITNHGTHDVYNLLVCFERTSTAAGSVYGHVVFIYGIIDGVMYFTEGAAGFGAEAGQPMECTIAQFAASYDTWTEFEGIVVLGCKDYLDNCASYQSDLFAGCVEATQIMSLPCQEEDSLPVRAVQKGERLHVIGLYRNREEQYYYQIDDGGQIGYVPAQTLRPILYLHDTFTLEEAKLPETLRTGKDFSIDGNLLAPGVLLSQVCVQILDMEGNCLQKVVRDASGEKYDLGNYQLNQELNFAKLEEGTYTCRVQADSLICAYVGTTQIKQVQTQTLLEQEFTVTAETEKKEAPAQARAAEPTQIAEAVAPETETVKNGWYYEGQTWYCYKQGEPCSGWVRSAGVSYYLKEDGSVTTGWAQVEGRQRLFTATGALVTGWAEEQGERCYLDANGLPVTGWYRIDGTYYYFNEQGILQDRYIGSALRQLRQLGLTVQEVNQANTANNIPQEE